MTTDQQPHERLAARMEARRVALRMQWGEVATQAEISTAHLRRIRSGESPITPVVAVALEDALKWAHGSIDAILKGGEPGEDVTISGPAGTIRVAAGSPDVQTADGLEAALRELARRLNPARVRTILEEVAPHPQSAERRYEDDADQHLWETPGLDERQRRYLIHQLDALRRFDDATDRSEAERPSADVHEFRRRG